MALKKDNSLPHFLIRLAGLTGLMALVAGLVLWFAIDVAAEGRIVTIVGAVLLGLALVVELKGLTGSVMSQRGAMGSNVALQIALAIALLVGVNVFSFSHYQRYDLTSDRIFTIDPKIRAQLGQLRGDTDIVVYLRYTSALGQGKADSKLAHFQAAAQRKIVEKVKDLADEFRELGPRFRVEVLDIQNEDYEQKLRELKERSKALGDAIEAAPENSIFFLARGRVQRLGFDDIYQLDSEASLKANHDKGNLVLNYQGADPFANKILNIEQKKPRIAMAVVHPLLSMARRNHQILTMNGAMKALEAHDFICQDILLRKVDIEGDLSQEPAALTYDENRFEQIEEELPLIEESITENAKRYPEVKKLLEAWKTKKLSELQKDWVYLMLPNGQELVYPRTGLADLDKKKITYKTIPVDEEDRANQTSRYQRLYDILERELEFARKERDELTKERAALNVDELAEKKRIADVEAKMNRMLADVDLLIVPRYTAHHLPSNAVLQPRLHKLDETQLRPIRAFIRAGKPVLFVLGPLNEKREGPPDLGGGGVDGLEPMLAELGVFMPKQTVLYNVENKEYNERKVALGFPEERELDLPPLLLNWPPGTGQVAKKHESRKAAAAQQHPIALSLHVAEKALGSKQVKELQARHSRPVYLVDDDKKKVAFDEKAVFLMAGDESWNSNFPFINDKREVPRFNPTPDSEPQKGTLEEVRRGPFPIAVAFERTLPESWTDGRPSDTRVRVAVIGNGSIFSGQSLTPIKQKLLLDTCNWLLGRDDLLAKNNEVWEYPRVELDETQKDLWHWGTFLGMPLLFVYVGLAVWLVRRMR